MTAQTPSFPKRALLIVGTEACERFSFYGMRSILTLYIVTVLFKELDSETAGDYATTIGHLFNMGVYFMPLLGAWIADKFWGKYWTIFGMSLIYCAGNAVLALTVGEEWGLAVGLGLIAFGSGGIKPCVSAFMGDQFSKEQTTFLTRAFSLFYWAINFGSFFAFIVIPPVKDSFGYMWAFALPGIFMGIATLIFLAGTRYYTRSLGEWMQMPLRRVAANVLTSSLLYGALPGTVFAALMLPLKEVALAALLSFLFVFVVFS
nr:MFS transporter [Opitutales bacterium]